MLRALGTIYSLQEIRIPADPSLFTSIRPVSTMPICLDLGTNNQAFLDDPFYLGLRQKRVPEQEMDEFMDEFMREMTLTFPKMMIQFEVRRTLLLISNIDLELNHF